MEQAEGQEQKVSAGHGECATAVDNQAAMGMGDGRTPPARLQAWGGVEMRRAHQHRGATWSHQGVPHPLAKAILLKIDQYLKTV